MPETSPGVDSPLDLIHLARQCLGDHELEAELLRLFHGQGRAFAAELSSFERLPLEAKARIAHTLRGSALAVGAGRVAAAAGLIEELARAPGGQGSAEAGAVSALASAVGEALVEIERLRG